MPLKDIDALKLYTIAQVAELFPNEDARKKKGHVEEVEKLILAHGIFRRFGEQILLTETDIRSLFRAISNNRLRASDGAPPASAEGHVVAIGSRTDPECQVFISWAPLGGVHGLVNDVQRFADFKVALLDYTARTYGEFAEIKERLKVCRYFGNWYTRCSNSLETRRVMEELFTNPANDGETDDENGHEG